MHLSARTDYSNQGALGLPILARNTFPVDEFLSARYRLLKVQCITHLLVRMVIRRARRGKSLHRLPSSAGLSHILLTPEVKFSLSSSPPCWLPQAEPSSIRGTFAELPHGQRPHSPASTEKSCKSELDQEAGAVVCGQTAALKRQEETKRLVETPRHSVGDQDTWPVCNNQMPKHFPGPSPVPKIVPTARDRRLVGVCATGVLSISASLLKLFVGFIVLCGSCSLLTMAGPK